MSETIRAAFRESGLSMKRLNRLAGTGYQSVHGFFATGNRGVTLETAERWCNVLGLVLKPEKGRDNASLQNKLQRARRPKA